MKDERRQDEGHAELRRRAEREIEGAPGAQMLPVDEVQRLIHELDVHRIELQMQNDELRRAHRELESSRDRYADLYDFAPVPYFSFDSAGRIRELNLAAVRTLGGDRQGFLNQAFLSLVPAEEHPTFVRFLRRCIEHRGEAACELSLLRRSGPPLVVQLQAVAVDDPEHGPLCRVAMVDVTERRTASDALHQAKESAEAANRAKSQFLANISHELRTPMAAVLGMMELALEEPLSAPVRDCLLTAQQSGQGLLRLLNEILDVARIEAGRMELEQIPFCVREVVERTAKTLFAQAQEKGLALTWRVAPEAPALLVGDPMRVGQIVLNLLGNAIKFTAQGSVAIDVAVESQNDLHAELRIQVADTGIGLSAADQQRIFHPFTQVDASTSRHYGGSGLGLTIVAALVRLMEGRVAVHSQPGEGSTFSIWIKLALPSAEDRRRAESSMAPQVSGEPDVPPLDILVAEDTPATQKLILRMLGKRGHRVRVAANGFEAVELVRAEPFDVVLMDVQMPVMDGYQATAAIRLLPDHQRRAVPIVAMTAHAMPGDRQQCLAAGMDGYLAKPVDQRELLQAIQQFGRRGV